MTTLIELGPAEWGSMTRGQEIFAVIADPKSAKLSKDAQRARDLVLKRVDSLKANLGDRVHVFDSIDEMAESVATAYKGADATPVKDANLGKERLDLLSTILVSGTSGDTEPEYQAELQKILGEDMQATWKKDWDDSVESQERESALKERAAVKVQVITNDTASYGSIAEAYAMAVEAFQFGQRLAIVIEDGWADKKSPDGSPWHFNIKRSEYASDADYSQAIKDARNSRTALVEHFKRFQEENPHGIRFILSKDVKSDMPAVAEYAKKSLEDLRAHMQDAIADEIAELGIANTVKDADRLLPKEGYRSDALRDLAKAMSKRYDAYPELAERVLMTDAEIDDWIGKGKSLKDLAARYPKAACFSHPNYVKRGDIAALPFSLDRDFTRDGEGRQVRYPHRFNDTPYETSAEGVPLHPLYREMLKQGAVIGPGFYYDLGEQRAADPVVMRMIRSESGDEFTR